MANSGSLFRQEKTPPEAGLKAMSSRKCYPRLASAIRSYWSSIPSGLPSRRAVAWLPGGALWRCPGRSRKRNGKMRARRMVILMGRLHRSPSQICHNPLLPAPQQAESRAPGGSGAKGTPPSLPGSDQRKRTFARRSSWEGVAIIGRLWRASSDFPTIHLRLGPAPWQPVAVAGCRTEAQRLSGNDGRIGSDRGYGNASAAC
jgi:hypothetical protein